METKIKAMPDLGLPTITPPLSKAKDTLRRLKKSRDLLNLSIKQYEELVATYECIGRTIQSQEKGIRALKWGYRHLRKAEKLDKLKEYK